MCDVGGPLNDLLGEWEHRTRTMGREAAVHPQNLRRVMSALDAQGPSESGDCIQALVLELVIARRLAYEMARDPLRIDATEPP